MKYFLTILFLLFSITCFSQKAVSKKQDSTKVRELIALADEVYYSDLHLAKQYADSALNLSKRINYTRGIASSYNMLGNIYNGELEYEKAAKNYHKAYSTWVELGDTASIAKYYANTANLNKKLKKYDLALEYYNKALEIFINSNDEYHLSILNNNIGTVYFAQNKMDSALLYFTKATQIDGNEIINSLHKSDINNLLAEANGNIANVHSRKKEYDKALNFYFRALDEFKKANNKNFIALCLNNIAVAYRNKKEYINSIKYSKKALKIAEEIKSVRLKKVTHKSLAKTYALMNNYKMAYDYYLKYKGFSDSMYNSSTSNKVSKLIRKHEIEQKEKEQAILLNDNKLKELVIKKSNTRIVFLIILVFVFFSALIGVLITVIKIKHRNKDLIKRNIEIVESEQQLYEVKAELEATIEQITKNEELTIIKEQESEKKEFNEIPTKYLSSGLDVKQRQALKNAISQMMEKEKVYLEKDLTVRELAAKLETNYSYVSQIINQDFNQNFSNFINEYRIKEARRLLVNTATNKYSMEYISESVGFKSLSSFNRAFKKFTGVPPTSFVNTHSEN